MLKGFDLLFYLSFISCYDGGKLLSSCWIGFNISWFSILDYWHKYHRSNFWWSLKSVNKDANAWCTVGLYPFIIFWLHKDLSRASVSLYHPVLFILSRDLDSRGVMLICIGVIRKYIALLNSNMPGVVLQVGQLREVSNKVNNAELKLFLEVELGLVMLLPPYRFNSSKFSSSSFTNALLYHSGFTAYSSSWQDERWYFTFFQALWSWERRATVVIWSFSSYFLNWNSTSFDQCLFLCFPSYVGRLFVKSTSKPVEILTKLNEMAGYAPDEEIDLYEVCFPSQLFLSNISS